MSYAYHEPDTLDEALDLLANHGDEATLLAGGTSFVLLTRLGLIRPHHVVGLRRIEDLSGIRPQSGRLWIGAHTTHRHVERSPTVRAGHAELAAAFGTIASVRIRNQATLGGNLAHADPAQDPPPILIAFDATAHIASRRGHRDVAMDEFFVDYFTTDLASDEILLGVTVPPTPAGAAATYVKFLPRTADDYATVSVAAMVARDAAGAVTAARLALGGVGPVPYRAVPVERAIMGTVPTASSLREAAGLIFDEIQPLDDIRGSARYKRAMAVVCLCRALSDVVTNPGGPRP